MLWKSTRYSIKNILPINAKETYSLLMRDEHAIYFQQYLFGSSAMAWNMSLRININ
jgi:hypothetical protein